MDSSSHYSTQKLIFLAPCSHSALTDFLASHNISAAQIAFDFEARQAEAAEVAEAERRADISRNPDGQQSTEPPAETAAQTKKRKREEEKAIEKIKKSKQFKMTVQGVRRDRRYRENDENPEGEYNRDDDDDDDLVNELAHEAYMKSKSVSSLPGQLANCAMCSKRFTVTNYTKAGPEGGLLCPECAKTLDKDNDKGKQKKKKSTEKGNKQRQMRSNLLDGVVQRGAKSLVQMCVEKIADHIGDVEDFGILPNSLLNQLSLVLSRRRLLNSRTIDFFLKPRYDSVTLYDAANLTTNDFKKIFMVCPNVKSLTMDCAGQFKDEVLEYVTENPAINIVHFRVGALNLIHDAVWRRFFIVKGQTLETIKLNWMDNYFDDETFQHLVRHCPNLTRLKMKRMWKLSGKAIEAMSDITQLRHLTFERANLGISEIYSASWVKFLAARGKDLQTFAIDRFHLLDDDLLSAVHDHCRHLSKLRISSNANFADGAGFELLFSHWANPPLRYINFSMCRDVDAKIPVANPEDVGLCGSGFAALMAHSGSRLETLYVTSCRHIDHAAFFAVFDGVKQYPHLSFVDVSFCDAVDDVVLNGMFASCPSLKEVMVFGCFKIAEPAVPNGVLVTGRVNAQDDVIYRTGED
ncbi:MAG: hypothetical protein M1816_005809 [Peltula sp. TS41687]|nr:MAG: hypothetical protein M1816_005809 [Peltula sp. TS41687]